MPHPTDRPFPPGDIVGLTSALYRSGRGYHSLTISHQHEWSTEWATERFERLTLDEGLDALSEATAVLGAGICSCPPV